MNISFIAGLAQRLIVVCLVALVLWHVTHHGPLPHGSASIYVPRENDVLIIDGRPYPSKSTSKPVVCDLEAGNHNLKVKRGPFTITEEEFTIEPGRAIILTPKDPVRRAKLLSGSPKTNPDLTNPAGLAIRTTRSQPTPN
jgi:hypothetical protein